MTRAGWSHNSHYHSLLLHAAPRPCGNALDAGCGHGDFARKLAMRCGHVTAIDLAPGPSWPAPANVSFLQGDVLAFPFAPNAFDYIVAVASLHHLPLEAALIHFRELLTPGGVLAIVGLYRPQTLDDHLLAAAALPVSRALTLMLGRDTREVAICAPGPTLAEIRSAASTILPGSIVRRRLFFRYTLLWRKPGEPSSHSKSR